MFDYLYIYSELMVEFLDLQYLGERFNSTAVRIVSSATFALSIVSLTVISTV